MLNKDKFRGCMVGGAVGDALGYPVEFMRHREIVAKYGCNGITNYELHHGKALVSDDTQMTMYTANSLLFAYSRMMSRGIGAPLHVYVAKSYGEWYFTQCCKKVEELKQNLGTEYLTCWISNIPEMYASRAPGNTCLNAIRQGAMGTVDEPINDSKGCGGVMRVAPVGLFASAFRWEARKVMSEGAAMAAITHGHELGYIPAAALAYIINQIVTKPDTGLVEIVKDTIRYLNDIFEDKQHLAEMTRLLYLAIELSESQMDDFDAIKQLGKGWVGEEALAVAVYCALKHSDSFEDAVIAAVNHGGDSDSTGAICGNIMGAYLGFNAIPAKYIGKLELLEELLELADDLAILPDVDIDEYGADDLWNDKYIRNIYPERRIR